MFHALKWTGIFRLPNPWSPGQKLLLGPCVSTQCCSGEDIAVELAFITYAAQGFQGTKKSHWPRDNMGITLVSSREWSQPSNHCSISDLGYHLWMKWGTKNARNNPWERDGRKDHFLYKFQLEVLNSEAENHCEQLFFLKTYVSLFHTFWWAEWDRIPNTAYLSFFIQWLIFSLSGDHLFRIFQSSWAVSFSFSLNYISFPFF